MQGKGIIDTFASDAGHYDMESYNSCFIRNHLIIQFFSAILSTERSDDISAAPSMEK